MKIGIIDEQDLAVDPGLLRRLAQTVLVAEGYGSHCLVDVTLVPDTAITGMNHRHRGSNGATDVLAFPLQDLEPGSARPSDGSNGPPLHLGDVVVAPGYVSRRAARAGWDFCAEMGLMVVHGVMHLLGYRHDSDSEAAIMERRERRYLAKQGLTRR